MVGIMVVGWKDFGRDYECEGVCVCWFLLVDFIYGLWVLFGVGEEGIRFIKVE